ncbi:D-inositol-3-phosphate glycosyltransferase [Rhodococcus sp. B10]|nr:D-inositol-3-phosphate glycosyltransferase [Rhodococcus sp. B10]
MRVLMPGRILERHVGGNTTYARELADGLRARGTAVESMRFHGSAPMTMLSETVQGLRRTDAVLHYVADTGPLLRTRTPSVVTVHGIASRWIDGVRSGAQEKIWRTRVARAVASTDAVVTVSASSAEDIAEVFGVDLATIHVVPHGIDADAFAEPVSLSDDVRGRVPDEYLLYVGNIEPRKNLVALVEAMSRPDVRALGLPLVIAGKPAWNFDASMDAISKSPDVIHLGFVSDDDRRALMQRTSLFVFPSLYEGFGFPVLEAMAAGAPVLTSNRGALRDIAGPAGVLGDIDADGIADGIVRAAEDSEWRASVPARGRLWASSFTWDVSVDAHLRVYEKAAAS